MTKRIYSIPASLPFCDVLAQWVIQNYAKEALSLPRVLLLLPSRRGCLAMREAFLRASNGHPTLLPRMQPLGEVDTDTLLSLSAVHNDDSMTMPSESFEYKRLFILARLIRAYHSTIHGKTERMDHALQQAHDIAQLLDTLEREEGTLANITSLVPEDFAMHWQLTTEFLTIVAQHWPSIAIDKKLTSPEQWRKHTLSNLATIWKNTPPDYPVIAAGSTGSIAATSNLLRVIAQLPQGTVVLPGLDRQISNDYYEAITESHPQWGLKSLLAELAVELSEVSDLAQALPSGEARSQLIARALCPPESFGDWQTIPPNIGVAVQGLGFIACADQQEEASAIALMLRETLETSQKTAALVTHDRALARRVVAEMLRYGVQLDDSAGQPLSTTPAASFLRLVLEVAESDAAPVKLLALLKHPLAHLGLERMACLEAARMLENEVLRGVCPSEGIKGLAAAAVMKNASNDVHTLLATLEQYFEPLHTLFITGGNHEFGTVLQAHIACATQLAGENLWKQREAKTLISLLDNLRDAADEAEAIEISAYPALFDVLLLGKAVRLEFGMHPRLKILSPIEARMQSFDRIILGGLNEGVWPREVSSDPWFNRAMRKAIGLPMPEISIGQSAHDFSQLAAAPEVFITRAQKVDGSPTTPARWWVRLETLIWHYGLKEATMAYPYTAWARNMGLAQEIAPCTRPAPMPPLDARPKEIAITQVEKWLQDPYAFYARSILKLKKLDEVDKDPVASDFGNDVHKALELFVAQHPKDLPQDSLRVLLKLGYDVFTQYAQYYPVVRAWWWPRFEQVAQWIIEQETKHRPDSERIWTEVTGHFTLEGITFTGRADRIEQTKANSLAIVDYKTGGAHSVKDTREGNAVQLMLLALLAQEGKWNADITQKSLSRLEYWIAGGGRNNGEVRKVANYDVSHIALIKEKLIALIKVYQNPEKPYAASASQENQRYNDHDHLARVKEWR